jgi:hypothetical protein
MAEKRSAWPPNGILRGVSVSLPKIKLVEIELVEAELVKAEW